MIFLSENKEQGLTNQREILRFYSIDGVENGEEVGLLEGGVGEITKAIYLNDKLVSFSLNSILTSYFLSLF